MNLKITDTFKPQTITNITARPHWALPLSWRRDVSPFDHLRQVTTHNSTRTLGAGSNKCLTSAIQTPREENIRDGRRKVTTRLNIRSDDVATRLVLQAQTNRAGGGVLSSSHLAKPRGEHWTEG